MKMPFVWMHTHEWLKCPSVCRENRFFYYRRIDGIAYRVVQDWDTNEWFLHISQN